jgi:4-hydroxy-tetrahydrodipicolinate synthase
VERLAPISNIVGIKEALGKVERIEELVRRCGDRLGVFSGDDATTMESILAGGKGVISVTANVAPRLMHDMCAAACRCDRDEATELDARLAGLHRALFVEANPIPVKWALHEMGLIDVGIRLPLTPLSPDYYDELRAAMRQAEIVLPGDSDA